MKLSPRSVAWLLPLLLTACFHKTPQTQVQPLAPPIEDAPPLKPEPSPTDLPPPVVTAPNQQPSDANAQPQPAPKPPVRHKKPAPPASTQQASNGSPGVSAIGQLSSGDPTELQQQAMNSITAIERGLNSISRNLNGQEQKTAAQIREFLKHARTALASGDVDGAQTLAAKAKVLLGELSQ
jgi:ribosomal protein S20